MSLRLMLYMYSWVVLATSDDSSGHLLPISQKCDLWMDFDMLSSKTFVV